MRISDWSSDVCSSDLYIIRIGLISRIVCALLTIWKVRITTVHFNIYKRVCWECCCVRKSRTQFVRYEGCRSGRGWPDGLSRGNIGTGGDDHRLDGADHGHYPRSEEHTSELSH